MVYSFLKSGRYLIGGAVTEVKPTSLLFEGLLPLQVHQSKGPKPLTWSVQGFYNRNRNYVCGFGDPFCFDTWDPWGWCRGFHGAKPLMEVFEPKISEAENLSSRPELLQDSGHGALLLWVGSS